VSFKEKINEVDEKLSNLLVEFNVGVDGGDKTLMELVNSVFDDMKKIENFAENIEIEVEAAGKNNDALDENLKNTQEVIRQIQDEINRLMNATTVKGKEALQDAFDRSEKFNSNLGQLKDVLDEVKLILKDYEDNLKNAKNLTEKAIGKFAEVSLQVNETLTEQEENEEKLSKISDLKMTDEELKNVKKLASEALEKANRVFEDAFDLLNEVSKVEMDGKLDEVNEKVEKLKNFSGKTDKSLKEFADENAKFLDDMEKTIETAEVAEERAFKLKGEIEILLEQIKQIHEYALKALADKDDLISKARHILSGLENFTLKVEKSRESARIALEKLPETIKKIGDSVAIVEKLEEKLDEETKVAIEAKEKCTKVKIQTDEVLAENDGIKLNIEQLENDFENQPEEIISNDKEQTRISDEIDRLENLESDDSKLIESTQEKVESAKSKTPETDEKVEDALKRVKKLMDNLGNLKEIDKSSLDDFGKNFGNAK
jgi:chromosome segregation ATPase